MNAMPYIVTYNESFDAHCIRALRAHTLTHTLCESVSSFSCLFAYFNEISMAQQKEKIEMKHQFSVSFAPQRQQQQPPHQPYCSRESNMCNDLCHTPFCTFAKLKIDEQMHVCTVSFVSDWASSTVSRDQCQWNDPIRNILCVNLNSMDGFPWRQTKLAIFTDAKLSLRSINTRRKLAFGKWMRRRENVIPPLHTYTHACAHPM